MRPPPYTMIALAFFLKRENFSLFEIHKIVGFVLHLLSVKIKTIRLIDFLLVPEG